MKKIISLMLLAALLLSAFPLTAKAGEAIDEQAIIDGTQKLTYELMGAAGDGVTNDFLAIKQTHELANRLYLESGKMVTVYGSPESTYYIGTSDGLPESQCVIDVATDVDWQDCSFIIDDYVDADGDGQNDVYYKQPVFDVISDMKAADSWCICIEFSESRDAQIPQPEFPAVASVVINNDTTRVSHLIDAVKNGYVYNRYPEVKADYDKCRVWGAFIEDSSKRWVRKGVGQNTGDYTGEIITFDSTTGELLTGVDFEYDDLRMVRVFPIRNDGISIGNATITTRTNNRVYASSSREAYTYRGIRVRYTGNVILHNISHVLDEEAHPFSSSYQSDPNANFYDGIIDLQTDAYVKLESVNFQAHRPSSRPGQPTSFEGTYDISVKNVAYLYLDKVGYMDYERDMASADRWGVMGTNMCKYVFITGSALNRVDAHKGITDLYISGSVFGAHGLTLMGQSDLYAEDVVFDQAVRPVQLRQDYGACWDGNMYFDNVAFLLPYQEGQYTYSYLVYAFNTENWNFGYRCYFPNLYMNDIHVGCTGKARAIMLQICDTLKKSYDGSDPDNLYYFKGNVMMKNMTADRNIEYMRVFVKSFVDDDFNLRRTSYGGTNTVTLDIDEKVENNTGSVADPKFVTGTVNGSYEEPKARLPQIRDAGEHFINGHYAAASTPESLELDSTLLEMETGDVRMLRALVMPRTADQYVTYSSSCEAVAKVDNTGKVTAISSGSTYITVTDRDGNVTAQCLVIVDGGSTVRIFGKNRYETSIKAAEYLIKVKGTDKFDSVVITTGENYADALSGSYLANKLGAPILLIKNSKSVKNSIVKFIRDHLNAKGTVYILGGSSVVEDAWLEGISQKTRRLYGSTRYITNIEILKEVGYAGGEVLVCTGQGFADSLSASAVDVPILLVSNSLKKDQKKYLEEFGGECVFIPIGGESAVGSSVLDELSAYGTVQERLQGKDRYATSAAIADMFFPKADRAVLAYGKTFPDGLSAGPLAYAMNAPLLLVNSTNGNSRAAAQYCNKRNIRRGLVLGGSGLITDEYVNRVFGLAEGNMPVVFD